MFLFRFRWLSKKYVSINLDNREAHCKTAKTQAKTAAKPSSQKAATMRIVYMASKVTKPRKLLVQAELDKLSADLDTQTNTNTRVKDAA